jgi:two-component system nitrate/nitrite response regulator NarL
LARGHSTRAIAAALSLSPSTVRNHIQGILTKLHVHSRVEAVAYALEHGLVGT